MGTAAQPVRPNRVQAKRAFPGRPGENNCLWEPDENALGPGDPGAFECNDGANYPRVSNGEGIGLLHSKKGGAIVALAGHVIFIARTQFDADSLSAAGVGPGPGGKTFLWWAPLVADGGR